MRSFATHLLICLGCTSHAATIDGRAINVADGDTVTVVDASKTQHKIRLDSIDAPERGQPFGIRAKQNLERPVSRKDMTAVCHKTDRYGGHVCQGMGAVERLRYLWLDARHWARADHCRDGVVVSRVCQGAISRRPANSDGRRG